jgi:hypothetical protein
VKTGTPIQSPTMMRVRLRAEEDEKYWNCNMKVQGGGIQRAYMEKVLSLRRWVGNAGVDISDRERRVQWDGMGWI